MGEWVYDPVSGGTFYIPDPGEVTPPGATGGGGTPSPEPPPEPTKPDFTTTQTEAQREQELRDALAAAERNRQQLIDEGQETTAFDQSVKDVATKVNTIDSYRQANEPMPEATKALIYGRAAPFTDLAAGTINLEGAIKAGVSDAELRKAGISQMDIVKARRAIRQAAQDRAVEAEVRRIRAEDLKDYVEIAGGSYILKADWDKLDDKYKRIAKAQGFEAMAAAMQADYRQAVKDALTQSFDRFRDKDGKLDLSQAVKAGLSERTIAVAFGPEAAAEAVKRAGPPPKGGWGPKAPTGTDAARYGATLAAEMIVPGVYTARHWSELSAGQKAFSIALDAVSIVPYVGAAGRGAKGVVAAGRTARLAGAAKGVAAEAVAQVRAPVTMVLHPVQTVKGTVSAGRDLVENLVHLQKVPEAVITTTNSTVRIPVSALKTEADANAVRNTLVNTLKRTGGDVKIAYNGQEFTVSRSALMKEVGGGLAHATPTGEALAEGLKVAAKPGMPLAEQGLFLSHEPLPRFATQSAFGATGTKPTILIVSKDIAKDAISTEKIYRSPVGRVAELESKFPVGYQVPKPSQRLFTRIGPERVKVDILLVDKKLSAAQVAKLKALAVVEDLKAPFKPAMVISGKAGKLTAREAAALKAGLTSEQVEEVARALRRAGQRQAAINLTRVSEALAAQRAAARTGAQTGNLAAEVRVRAPNGRQTQRFEIRATGTPIQTVPRRLAESTRGKDITIRRTAPTEPQRAVDAVRRDILDVPEPPRVRVVGRDRVERVFSPTPIIPRTEVPRTGAPRVDIPRVEIPRPGMPRVEVPRVRIPKFEPRGTESRRRGKEDTEEEKRRRIAEADTKVTWQQGYLHGEPVHHVVLGKDGQYEATTVLGAAPEGALVARGVGQSKRTVIVAKGIPPDRPVQLEGGAVDPTVSPTKDRRGVRIDFTPDESVRRYRHNVTVREIPAIKEKEPKPRFSIKRRSARASRGRDLGGDIVRDRRGQHLRL